MDINFIKEQFEIAKKASHLSETIVIDVKTIEWLIEQAEKVEQLKIHHMEVKGFIDKNEELNEEIERLKVWYHAYHKESKFCNELRKEIVQLKEKLQAKELLDKNVKILVRQQAKKVKHLFPLENTAGYGQLCDKVLEQQKEIEYLQNELKKLGY